MKSWSLLLGFLGISLGEWLGPKVLGNVLLLILLLYDAISYHTKVLLFIPLVQIGNQVLPLFMDVYGISIVYVLYIY